MVESVDVDDAFAEFDRQVLASSFCYSEYEKLEHKVMAIPNYPVIQLLSRKMAVAHLNEEDVANWKRACPSKDLREYQCLLMYQKEEFPTVETWLNYLEGKEPNEHDLLQAFASCRSNYKRGKEIFQKISCYYTATGEVDKQQAIFVKMISTPHKGLEETYQEYSLFVSAHCPLDYTARMKEASQLKLKAGARDKFFLSHEMKVANDPQNPQVWIDYILSCAKHERTGEFLAAIEEILFRSVLESHMISDKRWLKVWLTTLKIIEENDLARVVPLLTRMIKAYPTTTRVIAHWLRSDTSIENFFSLRRELLNQMKDISSTDSTWGWAATQLLYADLKKYGKFQDNLANAFFDDLSLVGSIGLKNGNVDLAMFAMSLAARASSGASGFFELFIQLASVAFDTWPHSSKVWVMCFHLLSLYGQSKYANKMLKMLSKDLKQLDDPKMVIDYAVMYQATRGEVEGLEHLLELQEDYKIITPRKHALDSDRSNETDEVIVEQTLKPSDASSAHPVKKLLKASLTELEREELKRSREMFRVKIENLSPSVNLEAITDFLSESCHPNSIDIYLDHGNHYAFVELASEQDVLRALAKNHKVLLDSTVTIKRIFANTLWLTNFPPKWGASDLRKLLNSKTLHFLDVRFPAQSDAKERRFCYIDFPDTSAAEAAQRILNNFEVEGYSLHAEISNPALKHKRSGPNVHHQVYVRNMNFEVTNEEALRDFFSAVGEVVDVKVPVKDENRSKGHKNSGFAFVTFSDADSVKKALKANDTILDGRHIQVSKVKTKHVLSEAKPHEFRTERSIAVFNLNSTTSKARLQDFMNNKVGETLKVQLKPSKRAALVEFTREADAGRARLLLEGTLFEEEILHVGSKEDFLKAAYGPDESLTQESGTASKKPSMAPPQLMRRRRM